jgi:hypothetical protein
MTYTNPNDNTYCRFQLEWYGLDLLFTHDPYRSGVNSDWFRMADVVDFCNNNMYPFKITNVTFNPTMEHMPLARSVELDRRLSQKWKDSYNDSYIPHLAINPDYTQYIVVAPYALIAFPKFFEGWMIVPTNFYAAFAAVHEYTIIKKEIGCKSIGESFVKSFVINHCDFDTPQPELDKLRQTYSVEDYNSLDAALANPFISEYTTLRRNLFRFVNNYCNPKNKNLDITNGLQVTSCYSNVERIDEVQLFFNLWSPFVGRFQLFEELAVEAPFLQSLNESMKSSLQLKFLF